MTKRVLSCRLQLSPPLYRLRCFCHICQRHTTRMQWPSGVSHFHPPHPAESNPLRLSVVLGWVCSFSIPLLVAHSLAHVRYATLGCFFVITFDLEVESGGVRRRTPPLSWGIILWAPSHLNADGNIFQWFNSTPCNIPNKDLFFVCLPPPTHTLVMLIEFATNILYLTNNGNVGELVQSGERMQRSLS